jgi:large subunit ribosomal protein L21
MYAIFQSGGHQYVATQDAVVRVEKLEVEPGQEITFDQVLAVRDGDELKVGAPLVDGAKVVGKVLEQGRAPKIIVFKYRPKKHYKKIRGHRQYYTAVQVSSIVG